MRHRAKNGRGRQEEIRLSRLRTGRRPKRTSRSWHARKRVSKPTSLSYSKSSSFSFSDVKHRFTLKRATLLAAGICVCCFFCLVTYQRVTKHQLSGRACRHAIARSRPIARNKVCLIVLRMNLLRAAGIRRQRATLAAGRARRQTSCEEIHCNRLVDTAGAVRRHQCMGDFIVDEDHAGVGQQVE